jgi:ABC-type amino acid transport substrate-binding protein
MPNIDDIVKALRSFIDLVQKHPYLSVPILAIAIVLTIASAIKSLKEQLGWVFAIVKGGSHRQRVGVVASVCIIAIVALVVPKLVLNYHRPKPMFLDTKNAVLTREFNARWTYADDHNGNVKYRLVAESGDSKEEAQTTIPYHKISLTGAVTLQVTAIQNDGLQRTSDPVTISIYRDSIQRLRTTGHLVVGIHADDNPGVFCFNSPDAGYQGFDVDLSKEIAQHIATKYGVPYNEPIFSFYHWPELLDAPSSYDVDFIIASISRSAERQQQHGLRFSAPYFSTKVGLIQRAGATSRIAYADLLKLTVAANSTTTASSFTDRLKLHVTKADTKQDVFALLADGKVDGVVYDYVRSVSEAKARGWISREIDYNSIPPQLRPDREEYSLAVAPVNDELLIDINEVVERLGTSGMIEKRLEQIKDGGR